MTATLDRLPRRDFLRGLALSATGLAVAGRLVPLSAATPGSMRIGIIGSGNIGGAIGSLWADAGHEILFSSRSPDELADLVARTGPRTRAGFPAEAAAFGEVGFIAVPYGAMPQIGRDYGEAMRGKVVMDCSNPSERRDGDMAVAAREKGSGVATAEYIPGARVVRAFSTINFRVALENAHRDGDKIAIPVCGDDADALRIASELVVDAGFDPVVVGGLETSKRFDYGTPASGANATAAELRRILGM